ncbi:MAG: hypothetical protein Q4G13_07915 [Moraxella sp.]|nr:hypothetical protein [Moraxella sp.]
MLLIFGIGIIYCFYPKSSYSINQLAKQQPKYHTAFDDNYPSNYPNNHPQNTIPVSPTNNEADIYQTLKNFIDNAPFNINDTSDILSANDDKVQSYLVQFAKMIDKAVVNNPKLTESQKANILWELYKAQNWQNSGNSFNDSGFKGVINDALMWVDIVAVLPNMLNIVF